MKNFLAILCVLFLICTSSFAAQTSLDRTHNQVMQASLILPFKDINLKFRVINKMKNQARNLAQSDKYVLQKYILGAVKGEDTFLLVNCNLRGNLKDYVPAKEITTPLHHRLNYYALNLCDVTSKITLPQNMLLYKSVSEKDMKYLFGNNVNEIFPKLISSENLSNIKNKAAGKKIVEKGFMLASYDKNYLTKTDYLLELSAPKNMNGVLLYELGQNYMKTILINPKTNWEVSNVKIEKDKKTKKSYYKISLKYVISKN